MKGSIDKNMLKRAVAALAAFGALGGYLFKQWSTYKTKNLDFQKEISDNLYFRNLVNNAGAFYSLIDAAEEELDSTLKILDTHWDNYFQYNEQQES